MDSKIIYFKIENENCTEQGYVEIYNDDDYMPDWYYWKSGQGYVQQEIVEHKREEITGLTDKQYNDIEELDDNRYIYSVGKSFQLKKYINGKTKHFGTFKTLEDAIKARNELIVNNWGMLE